MAAISIPTPTTPNDNQLILAAWILGGIGIYLVVVLLILIIRQCLVSQGFGSDCNCCGKSDEPNCCSTCCLECAQICDCSSPDMNSCCNSICGPRKTYDVDDCFSCCSCQGGCFEC